MLNQEPPTWNGKSILLKNNYHGNNLG